MMIRTNLYPKGDQEPVPVSLIDHSAPLIKVIPRLLSPDECQVWIERISSQEPEPAPIRTSRGEMVDNEVRNNRRVMFDNQAWAEQLFDRVRGSAPQSVHGMKLCGANEGLRCYEYQVGQKFAPHMDGAFVRNDDEQSWYTFMVYLNEGFQGGETLFFVEPEKIIVPVTGLGLLFQHPIIHAGCVVKAGIKYVIRTDLMYRRVEMISM
jgi:prolyl 4-hydroxylase